MSGIPSPIPQVRFDQNPPLIHGDNGRSEGTHTDNVNERRVTLARNRNQGTDHTGRQPAHNRGFDNGDMGMRRSRVGNVNHDIGNDNEMGNESQTHSECSESEGPNGVGSETSDGSDGNAGNWITKSNRRKHRRGKNGNKYVVFSDPFLSIAKFDSKKLSTSI